MVDFDKDRLHGIMDALKSGDVPPPRLIFQAFASLVGERKLAYTATSMVKGGETVAWHALGLTDAALVSVRATHPGDEWNGDSESDGDRTGELKQARLVPLSEVVACSVRGISPAPHPAHEPESLYKWVPAWSITLRDSSTISIPSSRTSSEDADSIAFELLRRLTK